MNREMIMVTRATSDNFSLVHDQSNRKFFLFINRLPALNCFKGLAVNPDLSKGYPWSFPKSFMKRPTQEIISHAGIISLGAYYGTYKGLLKRLINLHNIE